MVRACVSCREIGPCQYWFFRVIIKVIRTTFHITTCLMSKSSYSDYRKQKSLIFSVRDWNEWSLFEVVVGVLFSLAKQIANVNVFRCIWSVNVIFSFSSLVIRGDKDERAVLCSADKTYDLKIADTSNLLLFVPGCSTPEQLTNSQDSSQHLVHTQVWKSQMQEHRIQQICDWQYPSCVVDLGIFQQLLGTEETTS